MAQLDLTLETLDAIDAPVSDFVAGLICGAAFGLGIIIGAVLVFT